MVAEETNFFYFIALHFIREERDPMCQSIESNITCSLEQSLCRSVKRNKTDEMIIFCSDLQIVARIQIDISIQQHIDMHWHCLVRTSHHPVTHLPTIYMSCSIVHKHKTISRRQRSGKLDFRLLMPARSQHLTTAEKNPG